MKRLLILFCLFELLSYGPRPAYAFNLWEDIQQQTTWGDGTVAAGTAYNFHRNRWVGTALARVSNYRMISAWYGVDNIPQENTPAVKLGDVAKIGINIGYVLRGFVNAPPSWLNNLVLGPAVQVSVFTTPHTIEPMADFNLTFTFGGGTPNTPPAPTPK